RGAVRGRAAVVTAGAGVHVAAVALGAGHDRDRAVADALGAHRGRELALAVVGAAPRGAPRARPAHAAPAAPAGAITRPAVAAVVARVRPGGRRGAGALRAGERAAMAGEVARGRAAHPVDAVGRLALQPDRAGRADRPVLEQL